MPSNPEVVLAFRKALKAWKEKRWADLMDARNSVDTSNAANTAVAYAEQGNWTAARREMLLVQTWAGEHGDMTTWKELLDLIVARSG